MDETIITKQCHFCNQLKGGKEEDFSKWFNYKYREHKNSTEEKTVSICPHCVTIISIICNSIIDYRERQKEVVSTL